MSTRRQPENGDYYDEAEEPKYDISKQIRTEMNKRWLKALQDKKVPQMDIDEKLE